MPGVNDRRINDAVVSDYMDILSTKSGDHSPWNSDLEARYSRHALHGNGRLIKPMSIFLARPLGVYLGCHKSQH